MQLIKCQHIVKEVLEYSELARDNDNVLVAMVWDIQLMEANIQETDFKAVLRSGKVSNPASIIRVRKILQNAHENLRGELWEKRKRHTRDVIKEINTIQGEENGSQA